MRPAFNNLGSGSGIKDRRNRRGRRKSANLGMKLPRFSSSPEELNSKFKEFAANDKQRSNASAIRQTVPTPSSSTT